MEPDIEVIRGMIEQIRPILAGHPPGVQGAVLADLQAIWAPGIHRRCESGCWSSIWRRSGS